MQQPSQRSQRLEEHHDTAVHNLNHSGTAILVSTASRSTAQTDQRKWTSKRNLSIVFYRKRHCRHRSSALVSRERVRSTATGKHTESNRMQNSAVLQTHMSRALRKLHQTCNPHSPALYFPLWFWLLMKKAVCLYLSIRMCLLKRPDYWFWRSPSTYEAAKCSSPLYKSTERIF